MPRHGTGTGGLKGGGACPRQGAGFASVVRVDLVFEVGRLIVGVGSARTNGRSPLMGSKWKSLRWSGPRGESVQAEGVSGCINQAMSVQASCSAAPAAAPLRVLRPATIVSMCASERLNEARRRSRAHRPALCARRGPVAQALARALAPCFPRQIELGCQRTAQPAPHLGDSAAASRSCADSSAVFGLRAACTDGSGCRGLQPGAGSFKHPQQYLASGAFGAASMASCSGSPARFVPLCLCLGGRETARADVRAVRCWVFANSALLEADKPRRKIGSTSSREAEAICILPHDRCRPRWASAACLAQPVRNDRPRRSQQRETAARFDLALDVTSPRPEAAR